MSVEDIKKRIEDWYASTTEAQRTHHFHQQKIDFAAGNLAIDDTELTLEQWKQLTRRVAGPCPCGECKP